MEEFIPIKNFETYAINKKGEVLDLRSKKLMKQYPNINAGDYLQVSLINETGYVAQRIHRLVAQTFIKNDNLLLEVDHINRNRQDNYVDNLRWVSKLEQMENKNAFGKTKKKYIILEDLKSKRNPNPSWKLTIRNYKLKFTKRFQYADYTLEDVVAFRNKLLLEHKIEIID
jgi:hypothetical protein